MAIKINITRDIKMDSTYFNGFLEFTTRFHHWSGPPDIWETWNTARPRPKGSKFRQIKEFVRILEGHINVENDSVIDKAVIKSWVNEKRTHFCEFLSDVLNEDFLMENLGVLAKYSKDGKIVEYTKGEEYICDCALCQMVAQYGQYL
jgi:hypothetical protein